MPDLEAPRAGDPQWIGEYRVIARLGEGGQGVVYLCTAPGGRDVAVKWLHPWFGGSARGRHLFAREVEAASRVREFTARVLDVGEHVGRPYIVSEYIAGESVQGRVHRDGPYGPPELQIIAAGTACALAAIHAAGLVHCDFKPANVIEGPGGPRVVDFGVSRALDTIAHSEAGLRGTPAFMAPEQVSGGQIGTYTDMFSWASTIVFAATREPPFGFGDDEYGHGVMHRIADGEPDLTGVPEPLSRIVAACLRKDPAERPGAAEVVRMFNRGVVPDPPPGRAQIGDPLPGHTRTITCVAYGRLGDRPVAVTGGRDLTAQVWDLSAHERIGPPLRHEAGVLAVACGGLDGRSIAVTGCQDHTLNLWDLADAKRVGAEMRGHDGAVAAVALGVLGRRPVAVSAGEDRSVRLWDLAERRQLGPPLVSNNSVMSVACAELDGRTVAVIGGAWDQAVRIIDLTDRRPVGLPLTGHTNSVTSVACGELGGRPIAVTGGYDRTVRVWDLGTRRETGRRLGHGSAGMGVAFGLLGGQPVVLTTAADRAVRVWDLATRSEVGDPIVAGPARADPAVPATFGLLDDGPIAITCHHDLAVRLWSLGDG